MLEDPAAAPMLARIQFLLDAHREPLADPEVQAALDAHPEWLDPTVTWLADVRAVAGEKWNKGAWHLCFTFRRQAIAVAVAVGFVVTVGVAIVVSGRVHPGGELAAGNGRVVSSRGEVAVVGAHGAHRVVHRDDGMLRTRTTIVTHTATPRAGVAPFASSTSTSEISEVLR